MPQNAGTSQHSPTFTSYYSLCKSRGTFLAHVHSSVLDAPVHAGNSRQQQQERHHASCTNKTCAECGMAPEATNLLIHNFNNEGPPVVDGHRVLIVHVAGGELAVADGHGAAVGGPQLRVPRDLRRRHGRG